jgi:peptidoglycan/LPS O-acetylase OafA/YrhL
VLSHLPLASYKFLSGGLAVQSFFIISGFYMALVLDGKYKDIGLFYSNRLLRLFPTYLVMTALTIAAIYLFNASATLNPELINRMLQNPLTTAVMAFENLFMVGQEMLFWISIDENGAMVWDPRGPLPDENTVVGWQGVFVPQSWSLSMELMFYAIAPFLARGGWKWIAAICAASIALRLSGVFLEGAGVDYLLWASRFFPAALFLFLFGMLAHKLLPLAARLPKAVGWVMALGVLAFIVTFPLWGLTDLIWRWGVYALITLTTPFIFHAFKDNAIDRWVGDLSYPIYMTQLFVIGFVLTFNPPFGMWIGIFGTVAMAVLVLLIIDHPLDRWRQRRAHAKREPASAPGAASVAPL